MAVDFIVRMNDLLVADEMGWATEGLAAVTAEMPLLLEMNLSSMLLKMAAQKGDPAVETLHPRPVFFSRSKFWRSQVCLSQSKSAGASELRESSQMLETNGVVCQLSSVDKGRSLHVVEVAGGEARGIRNLSQRRGETSQRRRTWLPH